MKLNLAPAVGLTTAALLLLCIACGSNEEAVPEMTDTERLREIGMLWGLEWPSANDSCPEDISWSANEDWSGFSHPNISNRGDGRFSHSSVYNSHQALERDFEKAGGWRIEIGEMELVRERVERWRESYVLWVQDSEKYAKLIPDSEEWPDCKHIAYTISHRGRRALNHIDVLLR